MWRALWPATPSGKNDSVDWDQVGPIAEEMQNKNADTVNHMQPNAQHKVDPTLQHIRSLFEARNAAHKSCTDLIIETLKPTLLAGVLDFYKMKQGDVNWIHVSIGDDDLMAVVGILGDHVKIEGDETRANATAAQPPPARYLRIGVPVALVERGSKEEVLDYLQKARDNNTEEQRLIAEREKQLTYAAIQKQTGFDLSKLTEEQRVKLALSIGVPTDTKTQQ